VHEASNATWKIQRLGLVQEFFQCNVCPGPLGISEDFVRMLQQFSSSPCSTFYFEGKSLERFDDWFQWVAHANFRQMWFQAWFGNFYFPPGEWKVLRNLYSGRTFQKPLKSQLLEQQAEVMRHSADTVGNALHTWLRLRYLGDSDVTFASSSVNSIKQYEDEVCSAKTAKNDMILDHSAVFRTQMRESLLTGVRRKKYLEEGNGGLKI
jgi:hypothetical protein